MRDRLVSVFVVLAVATVCVVVVWLTFFRHPRTVVHERTRTGPTLVVKGQALRPLPAKRAKRTAAARSPDSNQGAVSPSTKFSQPAPLPVAPQKRRVPSKKHKTVKTKPKPTSAPQQATTPTQTTPAQPQPLVGVTAPLPVTVCARPAAGLNC